MLTITDFQQSTLEFTQTLYKYMKLSYIQNKMVNAKVQGNISCTFNNKEILDNLGLVLSKEDIVSLMDNGFYIEEHNGDYIISWKK